MDTINIHWSFAFVLPFAGAIVIRFNYARWQAWLVGAALGLSGLLMIRFWGHSTNEYAVGVSMALISFGALLPEVWQWTRAFVQRRAPWFIGGLILLGLYLTNPGWLIYLACWAVVIAICWLIVRPIFSRPRQRERRR